MTIRLNAPYSGYLAGTTVTLASKSTEDALIAQGLATTALVANTTTGNVTTSQLGGTASLAIGVSSLVITNSNVDANSQVSAYVAQAAADGTALRVERIVATAGSFTLYLTANATAATLVSWSVNNVAFNPSN